MEELTNLIYNFYLKYGECEFENFPEWFLKKREKFLSNLDAEQVRKYNSFELDLRDFIENREKEVIKFMIEGYLSED